MKWIMLPEGHDWLKHPEVGAIANIDEDGSTQWHSRDGHHWEGAKSTVETWLEYGFVECTKEQAEASIANKTFTGVSSASEETYSERTGST